MWGVVRFWRAWLRSTTLRLWCRDTLWPAKTANALVQGERLLKPFSLHVSISWSLPSPHIRNYDLDFFTALLLALFTALLPALFTALLPALFTAPFQFSLLLFYVSFSLDRGRCACVLVRNWFASFARLCYVSWPVAVSAFSALH